LKEKLGNADGRTSRANRYSCGAEKGRREIVSGALPKELTTDQEGLFVLRDEGPHLAEDLVIDSCSSQLGSRGFRTAPLLFERP